MRMFAVALAAMTFATAAAAQQPGRTCSERASVCAQRCSEASAGRGGRSRGYDRCNNTCEARRQDCLQTGVFTTPQRSFPSVRR